ncbi:Na_H_Exchanger domain-containing protein, partial [Cephalotus follicularis]
SGLLLGASVLGQFRSVAVKVFPFEDTLLLETMANLGLTYYMFLVGLEMDLSTIRLVGKKTLIMSMTGILAPMGVGIGLFRLIDRDAPAIGQVFWAIALTVSSFPDVARLLSDCKLMQTDIGKTAMTSALVNDIVSWALVVVAITILNGNGVGFWIRILMVFPTIIFVALCWFVLRPVVSWLISHTQGKYSDVHVYCVITAVATFGFITDAFGSHSMIGAFMLGLIIPPGELGMNVMDKCEAFVTGILLPSFFLTTGLRTNVVDLFQQDVLKAVLTIALACLAKIVSTLLVSLFLGFRPKDGFALGVLMNTKGVLAIIVINAGRDLKAFDQRTFAAVIVAYLLMTMVVGPIIKFAYKPTKRFKQQHKRRTLERSKPESALRVITCVHSIRNVSGMINLLKVSNPSRKSPLGVFALHLVELTGRATAAMLIVHDTLNSGDNNNGGRRQRSEEDPIVMAFRNLESENEGDGISVQPLTVVSPYESMHEDINNVAEDKHVTIVLVPFHKHPTSDGRLEDDVNPSIRQVNQNLLSSSPCSVGIYFDRGLGNSVIQLSKDDDSQHRNRNQQLRIAMLFTGGSDDREALAYAWRMAAGNPRVTLTVVRFVPGKDAVGSSPDQDDQKHIDDAYINEFRFKCMCDESISYVHKLVNSGDQTVEAIRTSYNDFDLYVVGKGNDQGASPLTSGLAEWSEFPELGIIGDVLVQSDFRSLASVLVVQQYVAVTTRGGSINGLTATSRQGDRLGHADRNHHDFEAFVNHRQRDDVDDDD